ncbi:hypothetical protein Tco_1073647 [Tanacetum coccineum]
MAKRATVDLPDDEEEEEQTRQCARWTRDEEMCTLSYQKYVTGKWTRINGDCQKFNDIYKHLERKSEENEAGHIEAAKYKQDSGVVIVLYGNRLGRLDHGLIEF